MKWLSPVSLFANFFLTFLRYKSNFPDQINTRNKYKIVRSTKFLDFYLILNNFFTDHFLTCGNRVWIGMELLFKKLFREVESLAHSQYVLSKALSLSLSEHTSTIMYLHSFLHPFKGATSTWVFNSFPPVCLGFLCIFLALFPKTTPLRQEPEIYKLVQENYSFFADCPVQVQPISLRSQRIMVPFLLVTSLRETA